MSLAQRFDEELKSAMKAKEELKVSTLRMLKAAASNAAIAKGKPALEDGEMVEVIAKMVKQREESIAAYTKGNRPELAQKEEAESKILKAYLPAQLSEAELKEIVLAAVKEAGGGGPQAMGAVMKLVMPKVAGRADGKRVNEIVKQSLG